MTLKEKTITDTKKTNKKDIKIMKKEIDINKNEIYTSEKKSGFMKNNRGNNFRQGFRKEEIIMKNENFKKENNKRTNDKRGKVVAEKYLNKSQFDAVKNTDGYVRVIAGAGTGKTRTLTSRYLYITKEKGIPPENILCITFTNKAAKEMQNRIEKIVGKRDLKYVCTFHKLCIQILKEECHRIGYPSDFVILDEEDSDGIINKILKDNNIKNMTVKEAKESLKRFKEFKNDDGRTYINILLENEEKELHELYVKAGDNFMKLLAGYMYEQKKCFGLGFEDLLKLTIYTLKTYEDVRLKWQKKFRYIMVDEFQDVNDSQYEICKILSGYHKNLFVVGDPDQTIYSWRGAKVEYINNFDKDFPECMTISREFLGCDETEQELNIAKLIILFDRWWDEYIVPFSRRNIDAITHWACKPSIECMSTDTEDEIFSKVKNYKAGGRYKSINLENEHTIEFRLFRGTLNFNTFIASLQFVVSITRFVKEIKLNDIFTVNWSDFLDCIDYVELKEYMIIRKLFKEEN